MAVNSYQELSKDELRRMHRALYGHDSSLHSKMYLARAVTSKVSSTIARTLRDTVAASNASIARPGEAEVRLVACSPSRARRVAPNEEEQESLRVALETEQRQRQLAMSSTPSAAVSQPSRHLRPASALGGSGARRRPHSALGARGMASAVVEDTRPIYLRSAGKTGSDQMKEWMTDAGIDFAPPAEALALRRGFLQAPAEHQHEWVAYCRRNAALVKRKYRARLCSQCVDYNATTGGGSHHRSTSPAQGDAALEAVRGSRQAAAIAAWKIGRFVEQGPAYLYQVWRGGKTSVSALAAELCGLFVIPNAEAVSKAVEEERRRRAKAKALQRLAEKEHAHHSGAGSALAVMNDESGRRRRAKGGDGECDGDEDDDDGSGGDGGSGHEHGGEDEEEEDEIDPSDNVQLPTVDVALRATNVLELRMHLSNAQVRALLKNRAESDPVCRSTFLFVTEAACVDADTWLGLSGAWRDKVIHFLRGADGAIDSMFVDGVSFQKVYVPQGGSEHDPFKCTVCGNVRTSGNTVYARASGSDALFRGRYHCVICGDKTLHVSMLTETRRPKPRWDPTIARRALDRTVLSEQPFREFKEKRSGGLRSHLF